MPLSRRYWVLVTVCDGVVREKNGDPPQGCWVHCGSVKNLYVPRLPQDLLDNADDPPLLAVVVVHPPGGLFRMFSVVKRGRVSSLLWETEGTNKAQTRLATEHSAKTW
ncbi:hypothetical protein DPEC_G00248550 [Dallia pectoralis]|uniref:Uncharacterized protein n=1 Tax=Dallia pectoralis TaxID=75939 RepID=A0ACC2FX45_DALPE|nr:hypothetical protein DPEC_G00248550 [Dallia pectoralis]